MDFKYLRNFYKNKKVFITGHTGFKGSWMGMVLKEFGADVTGYALEPPIKPCLYNLCNLDNFITSVLGDVRDHDQLLQVMKGCKPDIVIHMAAQPIVLESYKNPVYTYETNVMGTVNLLDAVRQTASVKSVINVTTDKVYKNLERREGYREDEELNGYDPYSNSKSCSELVTSCYINSFFDNRDVAVTTCRAGNVIGGGDFARNRIIPDCVRAVERNETIVVRNPYSVRPYQHVLEPIMVYLYIAARQYEEKSLQGCYNIGPDDKDCLTTGNIVDIFCDRWNTLSSSNIPITWIDGHDASAPHEANFLKLDNTKIRRVFNWSPTWHVQEAVNKVVEWSIAYLGGEDMEAHTIEQVNVFLDDNNR